VSQPLLPRRPGPRPVIFLWVLLGAFPVLAGLGYGSGALIAIRANQRDAAMLAAEHSSAPATSLAPQQSATPAASPAESPLPPPTWITSKTMPRLRATDDRPVIGPAYQPRDPTITIEFPGWPFAFRVPPTWGCANGRTLATAPDAYRKVCIDEGDPANKRAVVVSLQRCTANCTSARMRTVALSWLSDGTPEPAGSQTWYIETRKDADGLYVLDLARAFQINGRHYIVAVYARALTDDRDIVLKIVNDIATQTS
jgi:hypothetical protein